MIGTGETHSVRELVEIAFEHVGLDWRKHVVTRSRVPSGRPRWTCCWRIPRRRGAELGWTPGSASRELVRMMVDADLERLTTGRGEGRW